MLSGALFTMFCELQTDAGVAYDCQTYAQECNVFKVRFARIFAVRDHRRSRLAQCFAYHHFRCVFCFSLWWFIYFALLFAMAFCVYCGSPRQERKGNFCPSCGRCQGTPAPSAAAVRRSVFCHWSVHGCSLLRICSTYRRRWLPELPRLLRAAQALPGPL